MSGVIDTVGRCTLVPRTEWTHFDALVRSIVYQQLSGKAAATIHGRVLTLVGDGAQAPQRITATSHEICVPQGCPTRKRDTSEISRSMCSTDRFLSNLCTKSGTTRDHRGAHAGEGYREMERPDVPHVPAGDGPTFCRSWISEFRKGIQKAYRLRKLPDTTEVLRRGEKWAPYRTIASWYMWRILEV